VKEPLEDVLRKAQYRQVTDALERDGSRVRVSVAEYLDLCKQYAPPSPHPLQFACSGRV
jgi:hypothetical protein